MQFAERWLGIGSVVVALAGIGTLAVQLRPHHHHHHHVRTGGFDFQRTNCSGVPAAAAQIHVAPPEEAIDEALLRGDDPYGTVFAKANVAKCLTTSSSVEMLIEIAADGHVTSVSHRPERPTAESRCIAKAVSGLQFPRSESGLAIRNVFSR